MGGPGELRHRVHIGDDVLEVLDQDPLARRLPVPRVVGGEHGRAVPREDIGDLLVPAGVLPVAVHHECEVARLPPVPLAHDDRAVGSGEDVFAGVGHCLLRLRR